MLSPTYSIFHTCLRRPAPKAQSMLAPRFNVGKASHQNPPESRRDGANSATCNVSSKDDLGIVDNPATLAWCHRSGFSDGSPSLFGLAKNTTRRSHLHPDALDALTCLRRPAP